MHMLIDDQYYEVCGEKVQSEMSCTLAHMWPTDTQLTLAPR